MENQIQPHKEGSNELMKSKTSVSAISNLLPNDYRSISQVIKSNLPSLAKIRKSDPEIAKEVVIEFITDFVQFLNVGKSMNVSQINQTSILMLQYFPHLNLADLKLFFERMKIGQFGKFYDRVDGQLILEKLDEYNQERMNEFEAIRIAEHQVAKKTDFQTGGYHPDVIAAMMKAAGDKKPLWDGIKDESHEKKYDVTQRWLKQFDNLHAKFGKQISGMRFLEIGETRFSIETFIERKFNNQIL